MNSYSRCQRGCGSPKEGMEAYGEMEYGEKLIPSSSPPPSKLPRRQKLISLQHFLSPMSALSYVSSVLASKRNKQLKYLSFHGPLSFGGLAVVAHVLHQPILDPKTDQVSKLSITMMICRS
ncbi:hypothetical protein RHSIM_Rhsim06G0145200 [Rhododendron simsii]|uniref:Uncharacterized protein n=1 Tax=Rhododendron simsii TaxID=118357 RepID=A0A834H5G1_RHOSS|nr:hypothetical protein RHSIM_Rhsim06G0145200 [Rhododendron simsii]